MSNNLTIWNALFKTDPAHVKAITGKSYGGNSPKPHYIIFRLTEKFGPVGQGFGWEVLQDGYIDGAPRADGTEKMHECRIKFWWRPDFDMNKCEVESYGCTKALYKAKVQADGTGGYWVSDEDAAKKSLTDAIVKAASWLGAAGDIFMGRWDDSKYVAELKREFAEVPKGAVSPRPTQDPVPVTNGAATLTPHNPETGEVLDDRDEMPPSDGQWLDENPGLRIASPIVNSEEELEYPKAVQDFKLEVRKIAGRGATRAMLQQRYAAEVLRQISTYKPTVNGKKFFAIFADLHGEAIGDMDDENLRRSVRDGIAFTQARLDGLNPNPAEFGFPFGDPSKRMPAFVGEGG